MAERLKLQPKPFLLGQTEITKRRKTYFELLLTDSTNKVLQKGDHRLQGLEGFDIWNVDQDKVFFYSPFAQGILVCQINNKPDLKVNINDGIKESTALIIGRYADTWFNEILKTSDLQVVARVVKSK